MAHLYLDDSDKRSDGPAERQIFVLGAYLATESQWTVFSEEWAHALADAGVTAFHATDFFSGLGEFEGWDLHGPRHLEFAKRFTGIAARNTTASVGFAVDRIHWQEAVPDLPFLLCGVPANRFTKGMLCARACLEYVYRIHHAAWAAEPIAVVFEADNKGVGEIIQYCKDLAKVGPPWMKQYISFGTGTKALLPLQGADLLAHEIGRHAAEQLDPFPGRQPRKSFLALREPDTMVVGIADKASIKRQADEFRALGLDVLGSDDE